MSAPAPDIELGFGLGARGRCAARQLNRVERRNAYDIGWGFRTPYTVHRRWAAPKETVTATQNPPFHRVHTPDVQIPGVLRDTTLL